MKLLNCIVLILTSVAGGSCQSIDPDPTTIMSYNIRYASSNDGVNIWDNRKADVICLLEYYKPAIFGTQEGLKHQLDYIDQSLPNYNRTGVGRDDGKDKGEFCAIYFDTDQFLKVEGSTFWLSDNPSVVSKGWDAALERICTYGVFENKKTGQRLLVLNAHYDHIGKEARANSSKLIINKIQEINSNNYPVVLMGDFNAVPESLPITVFLEYLDDGGLKSRKGIYGPEGTFTGFDLSANAVRRIDYVFVKYLEVLDYRHIDDKRPNNNYVSDHLPVLIRIK